MRRTDACTLHPIVKVLILQGGQPFIEAANVLYNSARQQRRDDVAHAGLPDTPAGISRAPDAVQRPVGKNIMVALISGHRFVSKKWIKPVVGVQEGDKKATGLLDAGIACPGRAALLCIFDDDDIGREVLGLRAVDGGLGNIPVKRRYRDNDVDECLTNRDQQPKPPAACRSCSGCSLDKQSQYFHGHCCHPAPTECSDRHDSHHAK